MQPPFGSYLSSQLSNQIPPNNSSAPVNAQAFSTNSTSLANLCNMLQNSMPMQPPQLGIINPQVPNLFNNSNAFVPPNMLPFLAQQPCFVNQMGFSPQNHLNNMSTASMFVNQFNPCQPQGQPFAFNFSNFPQQLNQSMGFPNLQNPIQNLNPGVPFQISNHPQPVGPQTQNPNFLANPPFALGQQANPTHQVNGSTSALPQNQNTHQFASFKQQGNPVNNGQNSISTSSSKWKKLPNKDFRKNSKQESSRLGYQKSQFNHMHNGKRKFGFSNQHKGKGHCYERETKSSRTIPTKEARETKRSLSLIYTEEEIKQWREERRKNFPSKANIEKKCNRRLMNSGVTDEEAKQRREQLKGILAKQAELGVEVAEIPSHYLSDSEKQVQVKEDNRRSPPKKGRSRNKHDKRGKYNKSNGLAKQHALANKDSSNASFFSKRKPTLLQKLLSADVRKEKHHLLQVFRFMVMNSFFEDCPEQPLRFPSVVVKEDEVVGEKLSLAGKSVSEVSDKIAVKTSVGDSDGNGDGNKKKTQVEQGTCYSKENCTPDEFDKTEEEGEIID